MQIFSRTLITEGVFGMEKMFFNFSYLVGQNVSLGSKFLKNAENDFLNGRGKHKFHKP